MYQLIDFIKDEVLKRITPLGVDPDPWTFETFREAQGAAEALGYRMVLNGRFLLKDGNVVNKPEYIKIVEVA